MTPLAHRIVKELTLPLKDRTFNDQCGLLKRMDDIHCFDVTEVAELIDDLGFDLEEQWARRKLFPEQLAFLPAPRTWIEFKHKDRRTGYLLEQSEAPSLARVYGCLMEPGVFGSMPRPHDSGLRLGSEGFEQIRRTNFFRMPIATFGEGSEKWAWAVLWFLYSALALINTPRIIGRRQHMPHRGLERRLVAAQGLQGKFPLHAWTEILLRVTPPKDVSDEAPHEAHYTGKKALHFCRAHLRVRNGKVEFVNAHWRGDGSLGIKQSRYRLAPPKAGEGMAA